MPILTKKQVRIGENRRKGTCRNCNNSKALEALLMLANKEND